MVASVLKEFDLPGEIQEVIPFGSGLINHTWMVKSNEDKFVLQKINDAVFKAPEDIATNIKAVATFLSERHPAYLFVTPIKTIDGEEILYIKDKGYFRLFPFVPGSHTIDVVTTPEQAFEAARQFGRFTSLLSGFNAGSLQITLPDFHNLPKRYAQFEKALEEGNEKRIMEAKETIGFLKKHKNIVSIFEQICSNDNFIKRVTHHDTKISNVLFDTENKGLCVIDLDTLMPGYFISDVGDMLRTYLSPASEEEKDFSKITIREEYFKAIADGYLGEMKDELTAEEKNHFVYAGKFMIYMQALRFLTDYLNDDLYYGAKYREHNFTRARNQVDLLTKLMEKEQRLQEMIADNNEPGLGVIGSSTKIV